MSIHTIWASNLKDREAKDHFNKTVINTLGHDPVIRRYKEILDKKLDSLELFTTDTTSFDNPNWAVRRAYVDGQHAILKQLIELLETPKDA